MNRAGLCSEYVIHKSDAAAAQILHVHTCTYDTSEMIRVADKI